MCKGAAIHAKKMATQIGMRHSNLAQTGRNGGYKGFVNTENIAMGQRSVKDAFNSWVHSPGHNANILNGSANELGFAFYNGAWIMVTGKGKLDANC